MASGEETTAKTTARYGDCVRVATQNQRIRLRHRLREATSQKEVLD